MSDANGNVLMSVAEIELLRCVFEATCAEHQIPREGSCAEHLARFLMFEFNLSTSTESSPWLSRSRSDALPLATRTRRSLC